MVEVGSTKDLTFNYFTTKTAYDEYKTSSSKEGEVNLIKDDTNGHKFLEIRNVVFTSGDSSSSVSGSKFSSPDNKYHAGLDGAKGYNFVAGSATNTIDPKVIGSFVSGKNNTLGPKSTWSTALGYNISATGAGVTALGSYIDAQGNGSFSAVGSLTTFPFYLTGEANALEYQINTGQIMELVDIPGYLKDATFKYKNKAGKIIEGKIVDVVLNTTATTSGRDSRGSRIYKLILDKTLEESVPVTDALTRANFKVYPARNKGAYSVLFGANRTEGTMSFASGVGSMSIGIASTAMGYGSYAKGTASFSIGFLTRTANEGEVAVGTYNTVIDKGERTSVFEVGIGDINNHTEKNAITVTKDGSVYVKGLGTYEGTEDEITTQKSLQEVIKEYGLIMGEVLNMVKELSKKQGN